MTTLRSTEASRLVHWKLDQELDQQNLEVLILDPETIYRGLVRNDSRFRLAPQDFIEQLVNQWQKEMKRWLQATVRGASKDNA